MIDKKGNKSLTIQVDDFYSFPTRTEARTSHSTTLVNVAGIAGWEEKGFH